MLASDADEITVVLFDLGNVICHWDPGPRLTRIATLARLEEDEVQRRLFESGLTRDFDRGRYTSAEWHTLVCDLLALHLSFEDFEDLILGAIDQPDPRMLALVDVLRAHRRVAMLTDNPPLLHQAIPRRFPDLLGRFDPMLFSYQLGALKPAEAAFRGALARLAVDPPDVLFIDDTRANVEAARALGMHAHHFVGYDPLVEELRTRALLPA